MALSVGIIGLPNVGKSTLFNALTSQQAETANYPFCTIDPNVGIVPVPDERLSQLGNALGRERQIPSTVRFVDIAGLVKGASVGEGLGNKFLAHVREVDVLVHVVRCFEDGDVTHVKGDIDPLDDITTIDTELALADLDTVTRRLEKVERLIKARDKQAQREKPLLEELERELNSGRPAREVLRPDQQETLQELNLLTAKPMALAANVSEQQLQKEDANFSALSAYTQERGILLVPVCAQFEAELVELDPEERKEFLTDFGGKQLGLDQLINTAYRLLNLITFFTFNESEVRAWEIPQGTAAPGGAGRIHTDFQQGFIRADVLQWEDLLACGDLATARQKGLLRSEGKEYQIADGDVIFFHFRS